MYVQKGGEYSETYKLYEFSNCVPKFLRYSNFKNLKNFEFEKF